MRRFLYLGAEEYLLHLVESGRPLTDADFFAHVETVMPLVRAISRNEYNPNTGRVTPDAITLLNRINPAPEQRKHLNAFASSRGAKEVLAILKNNYEEHTR